MRKHLDMNSDVTVLTYILLVIFSLWATFPELPSAHAESRDPLIKIITPKDGETVTPTFDLFYQLQAGLSEDSVDVFLDGFYQRDIKHTFHKVPIGKHEIGVKVSTNEPEPMIAWDHIEIDVKDSE